MFFPVLSASNGRFASLIGWTDPPARHLPAERWIKPAFLALYLAQVPK
jgi:hypothetical protein